MSNITYGENRLERRPLSIKEIMVRERILRDAMYAYSLFGSIIALAALVVVAQFLI